MQKEHVSRYKVISVIVPVYNQDLYLSRCLRSLLDQSLDREKYEIILINDGSNKKTKKIINLFKNEIILVNNKKNFGLPYSLNVGIKLAKGRFIIRVDSDDYVNKDFLNFLSMYLTYNNHIDAVCCDYYLVDDKENIIRRENSQKNPIGCAIMFRYEHLVKIGMYDSSFKLHEDKDLRIRFLKFFKIHRAPLPLYRYRRHLQNITNNKKENLKFKKKLITKHKVK